MEAAGSAQEEERRGMEGEVGREKRREGSGKIFHAIEKHGPRTPGRGGGDAYLAGMRCGAAPLLSRKRKSRRCGQVRRMTTGGVEEEEEVDHRVVAVDNREGEEDEEEEEERSVVVERRTGRRGWRKRGRADTGRPSFSRRATHYWGCFQVCGRMLHLC